MSVLGKIFGLRDGGLPTVPTPVGYPATSPPQKPRLRGLSSEDRKRALEGYHAAMRAHFAAIAKFQRERREKAGASSYKWVAISGACCDIAQANDGKTFSSALPPKEGHPAEGRCNSADWCRCYARVIVKGFE